MKAIIRLAVIAMLAAPAAYAANGASADYTKAITDGQRGSRSGGVPASPVMRHQMMLDNQRLRDQLNAERANDLGQQPGAATTNTRSRSRSSGLAHSSHTARRSRGGKSKGAGKGGTSHTFPSTLTEAPASKDAAVPMIPNLPPPPPPPIPPGAASSFVAPPAPGLDPSKIDVPSVTPDRK